MIGYFVRDKLRIKRDEFNYYICDMFLIKGGVYFEIFLFF